MSQWYEYDIKSRKALIILMERAKRPLTITAGKLLNLSLETFMMVFMVNPVYTHSLIHYFIISDFKEIVLSFCCP